MRNDLLWGLCLLAIGIYAIWDVRKNPKQAPDIWKFNAKEYIAGIGGIFFGALILLNALVHLLHK